MFWKYRSDSYVGSCVGVEDGKSGNGRQMRSCCHSPGKGGAEDGGKRDAGKHMGSQTDYSGEGDTPSKISHSLVLPPRQGFLCLLSLLTEQRQNQAHPHSSWKTKATQSGFNLVSENLSKYPIVRDSHSIQRGGTVFPLDAHLFDQSLWKRHWISP